MYSKTLQRNSDFFAMYNSLTNEATTYYEFIVTVFLVYIQGMYFYLP